MEKQKILIIDDDSGIRKTLADILKVKGYDPISAKSGTEGLALLKESSVEVVVIDLGLPDISGIEVLSRVKADMPFTEAIILTGNASLDSAIEAMNKGAFSYLLKPYELDQLMLHIRRAIEKQEAQKTIAEHSLNLERMNDQLRKANADLMHEIAERKRAEEALSRSEAYFRSLIENASDIITILNPDGTLRYGSPSVEHILGYKPSEMVDRKVSEFIHKDDLPAATDVFTRCTQAPGITLPIELRVRHRNGSWRILEAVVQNLLKNAAVKGIVINTHDTTERKHAEERIITLSITDQLTGLLNRRGFITLVEQQVKLSDRTKRGMLLFFADLDGMKWINDSLGHDEGDKALIDVATVFSETFRSADIIARIGGDEFAILAVDTIEVNAEILITHLQRRIDIRNNQKSRNYMLSISVGCSYYDPENPVSLDELMSQADKLMYEQKRRKKLSGNL